MIGQSAVARYATNGDTLRRVPHVEALLGRLHRVAEPGVASVSRVRAPGAIAFERTP